MTSDSLSTLSDNLLIAAILAYAMAMVGHAAEYAFGQRGKVAEAAQTPTHSHTLVASPSVGGKRVDAPIPGPARGVADGAGPAPDGRAVRFGRLAIVATVIGALAQAGCLTARGLATERVPWGNMYEFISLVCLAGIVAWLTLLMTRPVRYLGLFVLLPVVCLLGLAGTVLYADAGPLMPALNSYWLKIHVSTAAISSGIFMVGFVTAVLFLIRQRYEAKIAAWQEEDANSDQDTPSNDTIGARINVEATRELRFPLSLAPRLPDAQALERLTFRIHALAFPLWTFAIIAGAIWAEAAWTRYWGWDPKETWAFISWVIYAAYLHARATAGWRGTKAVTIAIVGWGSMMINLFAVNLIVTGLHSYSGIS